MIDNPNRVITKERIAVMQAFIEGKPIDVYVNGVLTLRHATTPQWNWSMYDYRIRPAPIEGYARVVEGDHIIKSVHCGTLYVNKANCEKAAQALGGRVAKFREVIEE